MDDLPAPVSVPSLQDLRLQMRRLKGGISDRRLVMECNARRDARLGASTPRVTPDTLRRILRETGGHKVGYSTVVHVHTVLLGLRKAVPRHAPLTSIMSGFRFVKPSERVDAVVEFMAGNQFSYAPYEAVERGKRVWPELAISREKLEAVAEHRGAEPLRNVWSEVQGGAVIQMASDMPVHRLLGQNAWELCLVMAHSRRAVGLIAPYDLHRVARDR